MCVNKATDIHKRTGARPFDNDLKKENDDVDEKIFISDYLALSTQYARRSIKLIMQTARKAESSVGYK